MLKSCRELFKKAMAYQSVPGSESHEERKKYIVARAGQMRAKKNRLLKQIALMREFNEICLPIKKEIESLGGIEKYIEKLTNDQINNFCKLWFQSAYYNGFDSRPSELLENDIYAKIVFKSMARLSEEERFNLACICCERYGLKHLAMFDLSPERDQQVYEFVDNKLNAKMPFGNVDMKSHLEALVQEDDRLELQYLIHQCLTGLYKMTPNDSRPYNKTLLEVWNDPSISLEELAGIFKNALKEQRDFFLNNGLYLWPRPDRSFHMQAAATPFFSEYVRPYLMDSFLNFKSWSKGPINPEKSAPAWARGKDQDPEELITIYHGGGLFHLLEFFSKQTLGYKLEKLHTGEDIQGYGIQVSPEHSGRAKFYAQTAAEHNIDYPAVLTAKIKAKYLDKAPNLYEAGLRPEYIMFLQDVKIDSLGKSFDLSSDNAERIKEEFEHVFSPRMS